MQNRGSRRHLRGRRTSLRSRSRWAGDDQEGMHPGRRVGLREREREWEWEWQGWWQAAAVVCQEQAGKAGSW